jgi:hypothetical protein
MVATRPLWSTARFMLTLPMPVKFRLTAWLAALISITSLSGRLY